MNILERLELERLGRPAPIAAPSVPTMAPKALDVLLDRVGLTIEALQEEIAQEALPGLEEVPNSPEFRRIKALPRRPVSDAPSPLVDALTDVLRQPHGAMVLRPIQAQALKDLAECQGLFAPIGVGEGKTLPCYLAPYWLQRARPLLVVKANLKKKTKEEFKVLAKHWRGPHPEGYRIESYELLGRDSSKDKLDKDGKVVVPGLLMRYKPNLIILDECHKVKNPRASVTRSLKRYIEWAQNGGLPEGCIVIALSGTVSNRSIGEFAHIIRWCLPTHCPVPVTHSDLEAWKLALDEKVSEWQRLRPGALIELCEPSEHPVVNGPDPELALATLRQGFRRRLIETPGVVASLDTKLGTSLVIDSLLPKVRDPAIDKALETLRMDKETPSGIPCSDGLTLKRHALELALGYESVWDPAAPEEWLKIRKAWAKFCREVIKNNRRGIDSELGVTRAVDLGLYPDYGLLKVWREVKPTFEPNPVPVWFSSEGLENVAAWVEANTPKGSPTTGPGPMVWVSHVPFADALSQLTGLPYFGAEGCDATGRYIMHAPPGLPCIASVQSNGEGRNLQAWNTGLVVSPPSTGVAWEQLLGRYHRQGQLADEVTYTVYLSCSEHATDFEQARRDAKRTQDSSGNAQRLLYGDCTVETPWELADEHKGARWRGKAVDGGED